MDYYKNLNENQKKSVFSNKERICVIAGPGCGKTKTLTSRIARIIEEKNESVLVLTFGRKAIAEVKERVFEQIGFIPKNVKICNIHSFCFEFLQNYYHLLSFSNLNSFSICDSEMQKIFIKKIIEKNENLSIDNKNVYEIIKRISFKKISFNVKIDEISQKVFVEYEKILRINNLLDFSDLLILTLEILEKKEEIRHLYQKKFLHILVDEFQDINRIQWEIIKLLKSESAKNSLFVVGDPNQCIYGFQGSAPQIIKSFIEEKNWEKFYLNLNYRSTVKIVENSNKFLEENKNSLIYNKLSPTRENGNKVEIRKNYSTSEILMKVEELIKQKNYKLNDLVILYRSNYLSAWLEKELLNRGIPYEIIGAYKFLQRSEVKDSIAFLRAISTKENTSVYRIFSLVPGIGKRTLELIVEKSDKLNLRIIDFLNLKFNEKEFKNEEKDEISKDLQIFLGIKSRRKIETIKSFVDLFNKFDKYSEEKGRISDFSNQLLKSFKYFEYLKERLGEERMMNVKQLFNILKKWEEETPLVRENTIKENVNNFINFFFLSFAEGEEDSSIIQKLKISNVHQVKGLEFKVVLFVYLDEGIIPSPISINREEEKRIFYVGITRAKDFLYLFSTNKTSRFIEQIER